jgi:transposase
MFLLGQETESIKIRVLAAREMGTVSLVRGNGGSFNPGSEPTMRLEHPLFYALQRYHLHFTPTSASWLNQVERWFAKITQQRIRRGTFTAVKHLEAAILDYIQTNNRNPRPFVWTATADMIFAKITNAL